MSLPSPIQELKYSLFEEKEVQVFVKRDDLIHPHIMGNKWRKLKYNLEKAKKDGCRTLLTFGGAFSNHIAATAAAAREHGLEAIGIIRGEELHPQSNSTLRFADSCGMKLRFVSRDRFREMREDPDQVALRFSGAYVLPEGGTNSLAIKGCREIVSEIGMDFDFIATSVGTGGTMAGLIQGLEGKKRVIGFSALKGNFMHASVSRLLSSNEIAYNNYELFTNYHFGGYGKTSEGLIEFINWVKQVFHIPLDPVYTGKMFYGVLDLIRKGYFQHNHRIILLHTGGIQGIAGYNQIHKKKIL